MGSLYQLEHVQFDTLSTIQCICHGALFVMTNQYTPEKKHAEVIKLPAARYQGGVSVEEALLKRRSVREYQHEPLSLAEVSQLLWAAQGITGPHGIRTAPSAGALYPLEIYLVVGRVHELPKGVYKYQPYGHELIRNGEENQLPGLATAALEQNFIREAAIAIVFSALYERVTMKYGERGIRYVYMDLGHSAQNVHLQAVSLNLGTVVVGAFYDNEVKNIIGIPGEAQPLCIMPVGRILQK
uniref:SagB/ThcOx family dehydrogenase n=1 Tax=Candidatus Loosdrechtia sp. TaxID=3101272 RepID=UPI00403A80D4